MKRDRDSIEHQRVSDIKRHYEMSVLVQEECFKLFQKFYVSKKKNFRSKLRWQELFRRIKLTHKIGKSSMGEIVYTMLKSDSTNVSRDIVMQSFLDEWAYWLDTNSEKIGSIVTKRDFDSIVISAKAFIDDLARRRTYIEMIGKNPSALLKMAKHNIKSNPSEAIRLLDVVITTEPVFSEAAFYYKAMAIGNQLKWSKESLKTEVKHLLGISKKMFESSRDQCFLNAATIAKLKRSNNAKLVQINAFEEQMSTSRQIYDVLIDSVDNILGHTMSPSDFASEAVKKRFVDPLFKKLQNDNILSLSQIIPDCHKNDTIKATASSFGIDRDEFLSLIKSHNHHVFDEKQFTSDIEKLQYPSREKFWDYLKYHNVLQNENIFYEFNMAEAEEFIEGLTATLKTLKTMLGTEEKSDRLFLYPLSEPAVGETMCIDADECTRGIERSTLEKLIDNGIAKMNKNASVDRVKLGKLELTEFCSINKENLLSANIPAADAQLILKDLERQDYVEKRGECYFLKDVERDISSLHFTEFPLYDYVMKSLIRFSCCYQFAAQKMRVDNDLQVMDMLPCKTHVALMVDIAEDLVTMPKVIYEDTLSTEKSELKSFYRHLPVELHDEKSARQIVNIINRSRSVLIGMESPEGVFVDISSKFEDASTDMLAVLNSFSLNGIEEMVSFQEKAYTAKMIWNTVAVIALGLCQLMIGVAIEVFTVGAMTWVGAGFINEGINDLMFAAGALWSGRFSWANYRTQKMISLAFTACSFGLAALFSRGAQVSRFGSKLFSSGESAAGLVGKELIEKVGVKTILKECSKRVAVKAVQGLAFGAVSAGIDSLVNNYIKQYCDSLVSKMMDSVHESVRKHNINQLLDKAYVELGPVEARKLLIEANGEFFSEKSVAGKYLQYCKTLADCFARGLSEAATKSSSASVTGSQVIGMCVKAAAVVEKTYSINQMYSLTDRLLDDMEVKLRDEITRRKNKEAKHNENDVTLDKFKLEMTEMWRTSVNKYVGSYVAQTVVSPILKSAGFYAVKKVGSAIKGCYKWCTKTNNGPQHSIKFLQNKRLDVGEEKVELTEELNSSLMNENDKLLVEAMENSRDPAVVANSIRKGAPMEMTSVMASVDVLEDQLGCKVVIEVTDENGTHRVESNTSESSGVKVVRINLYENHFYNESGEKVELEGLGRNDCLYAAISSETGLKLTSAEYREAVAQQIEANGDIGRFVKSGGHAEFLRAGFHGGITEGGFKNKVVRVEEVEGVKEKDGFDPCRRKTERSKARPCAVCEPRTPRAKEVKVADNPEPIVIKGYNTCESSNVIYLIKCKCCNACYVGSTKGIAYERIYAHSKSRFGAIPDHNKSHDKTHGSASFNKRYEVTVLKTLPPDTSRKDLWKTEQSYIDLVIEKTNLDRSLLINRKASDRESSRFQISNQKIERKY